MFRNVLDKEPFRAYWPVLGSLVWPSPPMR